MLTWAVIFLVIALIAGLLHLTGVATSAILMAQILFGVFLVLFVASLILKSRR